MEGDAKDIEKTSRKICATTDISLQARCVVSGKPFTRTEAVLAYVFFRYDHAAHKASATVQGVML